MLLHTLGWREGCEVAMPYRQILPIAMKVTDKLGLNLYCNFNAIMQNISYKRIPAQYHNVAHAEYML